ncbi:MAG: hydrogenase maturation protease [Phycisphaerales bacterium]
MGVEPPTTGIAPILVLGVGNRLLTDDGVGLELLKLVEDRRSGHPSIEFIDGGTQGLALLGALDARSHVLILDAISPLGDSPAPGHVHDIDAGAARATKSTSAHASSVNELLAVAKLLGTMPPEVRLVGVEPEVVKTGIGLSDAVTRALPEAARIACGRLDAMVNELAGGEVTRA